MRKESPSMASIASIYLSLSLSNSVYTPENQRIT
ncbi:unnamed protein product [Brassica rapa subsp. trilocularis]